LLKQRRKLRVYLAVGRGRQAYRTLAQEVREIDAADEVATILVEVDAVLIELPDGRIPM
jgi:hypothetical protein